MKKSIWAMSALLAMTTACNKVEDNSYKLEASFNSQFDGLTAVIADYDDASAIDSAVIDSCKITIQGKIENPRLTKIMIDGKTRAYAVLEPGNITLADTCAFATGTTNNNLLSELSLRMDSVEINFGMNAYLEYVEKEYNNHKNGILGVFLGTALTRFLELPQIDSLLLSAPEQIKNSKGIAKYREAALLRQKTMPGQKFTDFEAVQPDNNVLKLSDFAGKGKYILVDFWASWCPYCIKEFPTLKEIYSNYKNNGFDIVGVAVRDTQEDTKSAVDRFAIEWNILYNAQRIPYDIYGFTGIPHLMLLAPDGTIISRGESAEEIADRLNKIFNQKQ